MRAWDARRVRSHLHAFTGVAQLKLEFQGSERANRCDLHAFTGVAQLKQPYRDRCATLDDISTPSPAWPN